LATIYVEIKDDPRVAKLLYSASPEECIYSSEFTDDVRYDMMHDGIVLKYIPPEGYCGAKAFLEAKLVFPALPFIENVDNQMVLSDQAKEILQDAAKEVRRMGREINKKKFDIEQAEDDENYDLIDQLIRELEQMKQRNIIPIRMTTGDKQGSEIKKLIYEFLKNVYCIPELNPSLITDLSEKRKYMKCHVIADKGSLDKSYEGVNMEMVDWSNPAYIESKSKDELIILLHDQTSGRSTEWSFHDRIFATHDYRKSIAYNTVSQAQLRTAHYMQKYGGFQPIRIYGHVPTFQLAAGLITPSEYMKTEWMMQKVTRSNPPRYRVKPATVGRRFPATLSGAVEEYRNADPEKTILEEKVATILLIHLGGVEGNIHLSQRISGSVREIPNVIIKHFPCGPENVSGLVGRIWADELACYIPPRHRFDTKTLFHEKIGEMWCGHLRGYHVLNYEDVKENRGWGIQLPKSVVRLTTCYKEGVLGVALRVVSGIKVVENLESVRTMYSEI